MMHARLIILNKIANKKNLQTNGESTKQKTKGFRNIHQDLKNKFERGEQYYF